MFCILLAFRLYEFVMPTRLKNLGRNSGLMRSPVVFSWFVAAICSPSSQRTSICLTPPAAIARCSKAQCHLTPSVGSLFQQKTSRRQKGEKKVQLNFYTLGCVTANRSYQLRTCVNRLGTWRSIHLLARKKIKILQLSSFIIVLSYNSAKYVR
jgi:hypothetical protein